MKENDKFAFPVPSEIIRKTIDEDGAEATIFRNGYNGMTLREYYAGLALPAIISVTAQGEQKTWAEVAKITLIAADALIAELEGGGHE